MTVVNLGVRMFSMKHNERVDPPAYHRTVPSEVFDLLAVVDAPVKPEHDKMFVMEKVAKGNWEIVGYIHRGGEM